MTTQVVFLQSSELIELQGLYDEATLQYVNDATVSLTFVDSGNVDVAGETWPLTMDYVAGSDGNYQATVNETTAFVEGNKYFAKIIAQAGGLQSTKRIPVVAVWDEN